jgi:hypothetical protein
VSGMFLTMAVHKWAILTMKDPQTGVIYSFQPGTSPMDGCIGFVPVFEDRESAEKWAKGRCEVVEVGKMENDGREWNGVPE